MRRLEAGEEMYAPKSTWRALEVRSRLYKARKDDINAGQTLATAHTCLEFLHALGLFEAAGRLDRADAARAIDCVMEIESYFRAANAPIFTCVLGVDGAARKPAEIFASRLGVASFLTLRRVPELDLVMGPQHANRLETLLQQVDSGQQVVATEEHHILEDITTARRDSSICGWVNVIYGCNERCTYCVVPSVRGREQSRRPEAIKLEMEGLAAQGYREITLLGQNIDAYGRDLPGITPEGRRQHTLTDLLHHVHDVEGIERIRFATSHPRYFTERLIDACADLPKLCEHFHIPFQSGDNDVLQAMARGYTVERYRRIIDRIRERMPDASLSADVIVAFPGDTDAQYRRTLDLIEEIGFDQVNTAAYSPRPNTPAANWDNQLPEEVKVERLREINALVERCARKANARYEGRTEEVLAEGINPKDPSQLMGRTRTNRLTFFSSTGADGRAYKAGDLVPVRIDAVRSFSLSGSPLPH